MEPVKYLNMNQWAIKYGKHHNTIKKYIEENRMINPDDVKCQTVQRIYIADKPNIFNLTPNLEPLDLKPMLPKE